MRSRTCISSGPGFTLLPMAGRRAGMALTGSSAASIGRDSSSSAAVFSIALLLFVGTAHAESKPISCNASTSSKLSAEECEALRRAQLASWLTIHADDAVVIRVERATFDRLGDQVEATILIDTRVDAGKAAKDWPSYERRVRLHCSARESAVLLERMYAGRGGRGDLRDESKTPGAAMKPVSPGALDDTILAALCR